MKIENLAENNSKWLSGQYLATDKNSRNITGFNTTFTLSL